MINHKDVMADFSFAINPATVSSSVSDETTTTEDQQDQATRAAGGVGGVVPFELDQAPAANNSNNLSDNIRKKPLKLKKKLGGALQKLNVAKWIDDLEKDQDLADNLDRINADNADEQERKEICRQAMEACLNTMRDHLLEFLGDNPQASYEEWIANLHPDNINYKTDGLTSTPLIDHRFYVEDSDHRILWNEHLNFILEDPTNLRPVRHYVPARTTTPLPQQPAEQQEPDSSLATGKNDLIDLLT
jgi:hypothetical protein